MYKSQRADATRRLTRLPPNYVPNQVIMTTIPSARNDSLPHFANVATGVTANVLSYGDPSIDGIMQRLGLRTLSMARVFVPEQDARATLADHATPFLRTTISANYGDQEAHIGLARTYLMTFEEEANIPEICRQLCQSKAVEKARPNFFREAQIRPNDEFYGKQWGLQALACEEGWDIEKGHEDTLIGIVDSGVDLQHEDLSTKLVQGYDFVDFEGSGGWRYELLGDYRMRDPEPKDEDGHGTHCAGIAAALSDNQTGIAGMCWGGRILPIRVMFRVLDRLYWRETSVGTDVDIDAGIKFAVDTGAHVINLSLGGTERSHEAVLGYAYDHNVCVFAATGNGGSSDASYPASDPRVLAVGAIDANRQRPSFSNYGPNYNDFVMAPGVDIASTYNENGYAHLDGTSMATPFVTGLGALIVSLCKRNNRQLPPAEIYKIIRETATPMGSGKGDIFYGQGIINVPAALKRTKEKLGG
jgi:subtilisin family serine protease